MLQFNSENRWRKRGIHMTPCKYPMGLPGYQNGVLINVMIEDGTGQHSHSAIAAVMLSFVWWSGSEPFL